MFRVDLYISKRFTKEIHGMLINSVENIKKKHKYLSSYLDLSFLFVFIKKNPIRDSFLDSENKKKISVVHVAG